MQIVNLEAQKRFLELQAEEDSLVFDAFSRADALADLQQGALHH